MKVFLLVFFIFFPFFALSESLCQAGNLVRLNIKELSSLEETYRIFNEIGMIVDSEKELKNLDFKNDVLNRVRDHHLLVKYAGLGRKDEVSRLLQHGVYVDSRYFEPGYTALTVAALCGHLDVVKLLLDKGADINAITPIARGYMRAELYTVLALVDEQASMATEEKLNEYDKIITFLEKMGGRVKVNEVNLEIKEEREKLVKYNKWFIKAGFKETYSREKLKKNRTATL